MRVFYTDGSNSNNGRTNSVGGFSYVEVNEEETEVLGTFSSSDYSPTGAVTNNRMELLAVISALRACSEKDEVLIKSDSAYIVNCIKEDWLAKWKRTGVTSTGKTPSNMDLWLMLERGMKRCKSVTLKHVKGHKDNPYNNLADQLARKEMKARRALEVVPEAND